MAKLTVIATIEAKSGLEDFVKDELMKLIEPTRAEKGCINYDLYQDNDKPELLVFHENWESEEDLEAHQQSDHINACNSVLANIIEQITVCKLTQIA